VFDCVQMQAVVQKMTKSGQSSDVCSI